LKKARWRSKKNRGGDQRRIATENGGDQRRITADIVEESRWRSSFSFLCVLTVVFCQMRKKFSDPNFFDKK